MRHLLFVLTATGAVAAGIITRVRATPCDGGGPRDVTCYGAIPNDDCEDYGAFQAAIDAGTEVYVPPGRYILGLDKVKLHSNTTLYGDGDASVLSERAVLGDAGVACDNAAWSMLGLFQGGSPTPVSSVTIRDLVLEGPVVDDFCEPHALVSMSGARDVTIERVTFTGFRGDGLTIGAFDPDAGHHNVDVVVQDSTFDGVDHRNRQAISILDGTGVTIANNTFARTTETGPDHLMPGAIDIEPDLLDAELGDIHITGNRFEDIGTYTRFDAVTGNCVSVVLGSTTPLVGLTVEGNDFSGCKAFALNLHQGSASAISVQHNQFTNADAGLDAGAVVAVRQAPGFVTSPSTNTYCANQYDGVQPGQLSASTVCAPARAATDILAVESHQPPALTSWTGAKFLYGDFDGDGRSDQLVIEQVDAAGRYTGSGSISIRYASTAGVASRTVACDEATWTDYQFQVGDFDGDQRDDLLGIGRVDDAGRYSGHGALFFVAQLDKAHAAAAEGSCPPASPTPTVWESDATWWTGYRFLVGNVDGDERDDVFGIGTVDEHGRYTGAGALFHRTLGLTVETGWSSAEPTWANYRPVVGDFDGDQRADLLWLGQLDDAGRYTGAGCIFTRSGGPSLSVHTPIHCSDSACSACAEASWTGYTFQTGDFDGDQRTDLLGIGRVDESGRYTGAGCLFTRTGGLGLPNQYGWSCDASYWAGYEFVTGDFDGDHRTDVAGLGSASDAGLYAGSGAMFVRYGGPTLPSERVWSPSTTAWTGYAAAAVDRNGDGVTDLAWTGALDTSHRYTGTGVLFDRE